MPLPNNGTIDQLMIKQNERKARQNSERLRWTIGVEDHGTVNS